MLRRLGMRDRHWVWRLQYNFSTFISWENVYAAAAGEVTKNSVEHIGLVYKWSGLVRRACQQFCAQGMTRPHGLERLSRQQLLRL